MCQHFDHRGITANWLKKNFIKKLKIRIEKFKNGAKPKQNDSK